MKTLHLVTSVLPADSPSTQSDWPCRDPHAVAICTLRPGKAPGRLDCYEGTGSVFAFTRTLWSLLRRRSFDMVHVHAPRLGFMFLIAALLARPRLLWRTMLHLDRDFATYPLVDRCLLLPLLLGCPLVVCSGRAVRASLPTWHRRCAGRRLLTVHPCVDLDLIDRLLPLRPTSDASDPPPLSLVTIGRLNAPSNHATILHALAQARSRTARLTVIGTGPLLEPLKALAAQLQLAGRVDFVGSISRAERLARLWDADGFIAMPQDNAIQPAALEAMGCFCPVVLSDTAAHRELRGHRADLIPLLPPNDTLALARAIDLWDAMPADVRRCWGGDCRQHLEPRFSLQRMLQKLDRLYAQLCPPTTPEWEIFCRCIAHK